MAPGARLFDLDGTLWDSFSFYAAVAAAHGAVTRSAAMGALAEGESVMTLFRRLGLPRSLVPSSLDRLAPLAVPHAGLTTVLGELHARAHPMAVVTSLPGTLAHPIVAQLGLSPLFPVVIHASSGAGRKPGPRPIWAALAALGSAPSAGDLYIGDTAVDQLTAARAGLRFAWASWGYGQPPSGAIVLRRPEDILDL